VISWHGFPWKDSVPFFVAAGWKRETEVPSLDYKQPVDDMISILDIKAPAANLFEARPF
jgi:hypothetical protein